MCLVSGNPAFILVRVNRGQVSPEPQPGICGTTWEYARSWVLPGEGIRCNPGVVSCAQKCDTLLTGCVAWRFPDRVSFADTALVLCSMCALQAPGKRRAPAAGLKDGLSIR